jgi:general secretion pathway protein N
MRRVILITVLAVIAFAAILIARMPAGWVVPSPPAQVACAATDGTLWSGVCTGLTVQGQSVGDVTWELHPLRLLGGKIAAHVNLTRLSSTAQADIESTFSGKNVTLRNVKADLQMDPALMAQLHSDVHGSAHVELAMAQLDNSSLADVQGHIESRDLYQTGGTPGALGSYSLTFPGGTHPIKGELHDLGGPLSVQGEVTLKADGASTVVEVNGWVAARPSAPADLANQLRILGTPDAQGRRPFSLENSF